MKKLVLTLSAALLVAACSSDPEPLPEPEPQPQPSTTRAARKTEPSAEPVSTFVDPWVPVPCDVDRAPTEVEAAYLVEAGPHVDSNPDEAAAAVLAMEPSTPVEWSAAILATVHSGTGKGMCEMMRLSLDLGESAATPESHDAAVGRNHFAVVLDASGSMAARSGSDTRMEQAKRAIVSFVAELPADSTVSLRIHGHEGNNQQSGKLESCASSEVLFRGAPDAAFTQSLATVEPVGWTPLATAIGDAVDDIPVDSTDAIVYVVSDGIETCGGDPVQAAMGLAASDVQPIINVIGFEVADDERAALESVADAGGGTYVHADSADALNRYWVEERERLMQAWAQWREEEKERLETIYEEQVEPVRRSFRAMRAHLDGTDMKVNQLEGLLQNRGHIEWETFSGIIHANDAHLQRGHDYLDELEPRLLTHHEEFEQALSEIYETSTAWREIYREN